MLLSAVGYTVWNHFYTQNFPVVVSARVQDALADASTLCVR
jgi:hypothetical protein